MTDWRTIASATRLRRSTMIVHVVAAVIALLAKVVWTVLVAAQMLPEGGGTVHFEGLAATPLGLLAAQAIMGMVVAGMFILAARRWRAGADRDAAVIRAKVAEVLALGAGGLRPARLCSATLADSRRFDGRQSHRSIVDAPQTVAPPCANRRAAREEPIGRTRADVRPGAPKQPGPAAELEDVRLHGARLLHRDRRLVHLFPHLRSQGADRGGPTNGEGRRLRLTSRQYLVALGATYPENQPARSAP